jgi:hypothetical protein
MTLAEELRTSANHMREKGMVDWAYLCLTAADHIALLEFEEALSREQFADIEEDCRELREENQRLREAADGAFDAWARGGETLYSHMIQLRDAAMRQEQGI